jgi:tetratricopeptide (TPR) repeat protein
MELKPAQLIRITKRLNHAIGYFELGMMTQALQCLDRLDELGELGPFKLAAEMMRAEVLRVQEHYEAAAVSLETAARMLPAAQGQPVWLALSMCYAQAGDTERAINSMGCARGAKPPQVQPQPPGTGHGVS